MQPRQAGDQTCLLAASRSTAHCCWGAADGPANWLGPLDNAKETFSGFIKVNYGFILIHLQTCKAGICCCYPQTFSFCTYSGEQLFMLRAVTYWQSLNSERALGPLCWGQCHARATEKRKKAEFFSTESTLSCTVWMDSTALAVQELLIRKYSFHQHKRLKSGVLKVVLSGPERNLTLEIVNRQEWDTQELDIICYFSQTWHLKSIKTSSYQLPAHPAAIPNIPKVPQQNLLKKINPPTWAADTQTTGIKSNTLKEQSI